MDSASDAASVESNLRAHGQALLRRGSAAFSIFPGGAPMNAFSRSPWGGGEVRFVDPALRHDHWQLCAATAAHSLTAARIVRRLVFESLPALADTVSFLVIPAGAAAIGLAYLFFKREQAAKEARE